MKIIDYKVVESYSISSLEEEIKLLIKNGWEPLGGVSVTCYSSPSYFIYNQSLIKYNEIKN